MENEEKKVTDKTLWAYLLGAIVFVFTISLFQQCTVNTTDQCTEAVESMTMATAAEKTLFIRECIRAAY